ncbi:hypothetical protein IWQ60_003733 [Tieghemiomyces parasiticus]|uniref:Pentacotripeptide-repeat region of PRORP domain-containing protein n=1 Tax=Tieghemiomyces parasiticus TaxID=78921 RepID=A0A9W8AH10_9FUNG|nr:hypothetical protein IWQ60_003733 [Tieghemiomyces parasiticus]
MFRRFVATLRPAPALNPKWIHHGPNRFQIHLEAAPANAITPPVTPRAPYSYLADVAQKWEQVVQWAPSPASLDDRLRSSPDARRFLDQLVAHAKARPSQWRALLHHVPGLQAALLTTPRLALSLAPVSVPHFALADRQADLPTLLLQWWRAWTTTCTSDEPSLEPLGSLLRLLDALLTYGFSTQADTLWTRRLAYLPILNDLTALDDWVGCTFHRATESGREADLPSVLALVRVLGRYHPDILTRQRPALRSYVETTYTRVGRVDLQLFYNLLDCTVSEPVNFIPENFLHRDSSGAPTCQLPYLAILVANAQRTDNQPLTTTCTASNLLHAAFEALGPDHTGHVLLTDPAGVATSKPDASLPAESPTALAMLMVMHPADTILALPHLPRLVSSFPGVDEALLARCALEAWARLLKSDPLVSPFPPILPALTHLTLILATTDLNPKSDDPANDSTLPTTGLRTYTSLALAHEADLLRRLAARPVLAAQPPAPWLARAQLDLDAFYRSHGRSLAPAAYAQRLLDEYAAAALAGPLARPAAVYLRLRQALKRWPDGARTAYDLVLRVLIASGPSPSGGHRVLRDLFFFSNKFVHCDRRTARQLGIATLTPVILRALAAELPAHVNLTAFAAATNPGTSAPLSSPMTAPTIAAKPVGARAPADLLALLRSDPDLAPIIHLAVLTSWAQMYDAPADVLNLAERRLWASDLDPIYFDHVIVNGQSLSPVHPPLPLHALAALSLLRNDKSLPWPVFLPAYIIVAATAFRFGGNRDPSFLRPQSPKSLPNATVVRLFFDAVRTPPLQRLRRERLPRNIYHAYRTCLLWPVHRTTRDLDVLALLTNTVLAAQASTEIRDSSLDLKSQHFTHVLRALARNSRMDEARLIYQRMLRARLEPGQSALSVLLSGYAVIDDQAGVAWTFAELRARAIPPNAYVFDIMIWYALHGNDPAAAFNYYDDMRAAGVTPATITYRRLLCATALFDNLDALIPHMTRVLQEIRQLLGRTTVALAPSERAGNVVPFVQTYLTPIRPLAAIPLTEVFDTHTFNMLLRAAIVAKRFDVAQWLVDYHISQGDGTGSRGGETSPKGEDNETSRAVDITGPFRVSPDSQTYVLLAKWFFADRGNPRIQAILARAPPGSQFPPALYTELFMHHTRKHQPDRAWEMWQSFCHRYVGQAKTTAGPQPVRNGERRTGDDYGLGPDPTIVTSYQLTAFLAFYAETRNETAVRRLLDLTFAYEGWGSISSMARADLQAVAPHHVQATATDFRVLLSDDERAGRMLPPPSASGPRAWTWTAFAEAMSQTGVVWPDLTDWPTNTAETSPSPLLAPTTGEDTGEAEKDSELVRTERQRYQDFVRHWTDNAPPLPANSGSLHGPNRYVPQATHPSPPGCTGAPSAPRYASLFFYTLAIDVFTSWHYATTAGTEGDSQVNMSGLLRTVARSASSGDLHQHLPNPLPVNDDTLHPSQAFTLLRPDLDPAPYRAVALGLLCHLLQHYYVAPTSRAGDAYTPGVENSDVGCSSQSRLLMIDQKPFIILISAYTASGDQERVQRLYRLMEALVPMV